MNNIGFGCVKLTSNLTRRQAIKNLEVAYDNGIRHFDVARLYGFGLAEGLLAEFLKGKRHQVTITTKMGVLPNNTLLKNLLLQNAARKAFNLLKKMRASNPAQNIVGAPMRKSFKVDEMRNSLSTSLKELGTDYIDYLLLHEARVDEANNSDLIAFLNEQKSAGVVKNYGIGSFTDKLESDFKLLDKNYTVLQTDNSFPATVNDGFLQAGYITKRFYFSPFLNLGKVKSALKADPAFAKEISNKISFDAEALVLDLFLMQQRYTDPDGTFLFTSSHNPKIVQTIRRWEHVQAQPEAAFTNFAEVREMINNKIAQP